MTYRFVCKALRQALAYIQDHDKISPMEALARGEGYSSEAQPVVDSIARAMEVVGFQKKIPESSLEFARQIERAVHQRKWRTVDLANYIEMYVESRSKEAPDA